MKHSLQKYFDKKVVGYCLILLFVTFVLGRLHYIFPNVDLYDFFSFDAAWWWNFQTGLAEHDVFANDIYFSAQKDLRFITDENFQLFIVKIAESLHLDRLFINYFFTTCLYLASVTVLFVLGKNVLGNPLYAFLFALAVSQSTYFSWLRYPVFVPKMMGFFLFPVILFIFLDAVPKSKYVKFTLVLLVLLALYPGSVVYIWPSLVVTIILFLLIDMRSINRSGVFLFGVSSLIILIAILTISFIEGSKHAPSLEISHYYYKNHFFTVKTLLSYVKNYFDYLFLSVVSLVVISYYGNKYEKTHGLLLFLVFIFLILFSVLSHIFAEHIPVLRMLWYWRASYYSYVPGILLCILGGIVWCREKNENRIFLSYRSLFLWAIIMTWFLFRIPVCTSNFKGTLRTVTDVMENERVVSNFNDKTRRLVEFVKKTDKDSVFLMPHPLKYQGSATDVFMGESMRRTVLSRMDMGMMIVELDLTEPYYNLLKLYDRAEGQVNERDFQELMEQLINQVEADYIVFPASHRFRLAYDVVYFDNNWVLYASQISVSNKAVKEGVGMQK